MKRGEYLVRIAVLVSVIMCATYQEGQAQVTTTPMLNADGHPGGIRQIEFLGNGDRLLTFGRDQVVRIWETSTGYLLRTYYPPLLSTSVPNAIAVSQQGDRLVISGIQLGSNAPIVMSASLQTGKLLAVQVTEGRTITSLGFMRGGEQIVSSTNRGEVQMWSADLKGAPVTLVERGAGPIRFATSPKGDRIAVATAEGDTRILDLLGKQLLSFRESGRVQDLAFANSGNTLAILGSNQLPRQRVEFRNAHSGELANSIELNFDRPAQNIDVLGDSEFCFAGRGITGLSQDFTRVRQFADEDSTGLLTVSESGELFATANQRGQVIIWDKNGERRGPLGAPSKAITKTRWHSNSKVSWHTSTGENLSFSFEQLRMAPEQPVESIGAIHKSNSVSLQLSSGSVVAEFGDGKSQPLALESALGRATCFSLINTSLAVVGTSTGYLATFRLAEGKIERILRGPTGAIHDVATSENGRYLVAGSDDAIVRIWNLGQKDVIGGQDPFVTISARDKEWIAFTPEGYYAATPGGDDLLVWNHFTSNREMGTPWRARQFESRLFRPHVIASLLEQGSVANSVALVSNVLGSPKTELLDIRKAAAPEQTLIPPTVEWLEPTVLDVATEQDKVKVKVRVNGQANASLAKVSFVLNNRIINMRDVNMGSVEFEYDVPVLRGENLLSVFAWDVNGLVGESTVLTIHRLTPKQIEPIPAPIGPSKLGKLYVVAVGISEYRDKVRNLSYAHKDAEDLTEALRKGKGTLYEAVESQIVLNAKADRVSILDALDWAVKSAKLQDTVVIIISAHGDRDPKQDYYLAPHDADFARMFSTCIPWSTIVTAVSSIEANKVILLMDTCHAAGVTGAQAMQKDPIRELLSRRSPPVVYSSSEAGGKSYEDAAWSHGAFSKSVLDSFADRKSDLKSPQDGNLSIYELSLCVGPRVEELTKGKQSPTHFISGIRDFPVVTIQP